MKIFILFIALLSSLGAVYAEALTTVYIADTGTKYHNDGCRYLDSSQYAVSLDWACLNGYTPCSVCHPPQCSGVPIELVSFSYTILKNSICLIWKTATETCNYGFIIERRYADQQAEWQEIAFIPGQGTSVEEHRYTYDDQNIISGVYQYRLKQIDFDGTFTFSDELKVKLDANLKTFALYQNYPNPFNSTTTFQYTVDVSSFIKLAIFDVSGREKLAVIDEFQERGEYKINISLDNLPSGTYYYSLIGKSGCITQSLSLIK